MKDTKTISEKTKKLRKFLVSHANINGGKAILFFFAKSKKEGHPLGPPVNVSFTKMVVTKENYQHGHSVHAKKLTDALCEKIIRFSRELELNVFFSVPALIKNTRKYDDITGLGCAFLDDIPANTLSEDMLTKGINIGDFSFPASTVIQTSPGNCQVLWNFKGFLPADERYKGPQPPFLPALPKHRKDLFNRMLRLLKKRLGGDPGGSNLNQIYRLPFTLNHKPKYSPAPEVKLRYSDFSPNNRINFGEFYTELLIPELKKHYQNNFENIFTKIHKNNDWILMENLLGWGESADDIGRSWTANERDMSAAKRLSEHYKIPRETIQKLIIQSPNRQKGQDKGSQYFDSLFSKLKNLPAEKKESRISVRGRTTFDLLRVFGEASALLFSPRKNVVINLPSEEGKLEVWRTGSGMSRRRGKILMWTFSEAKKMYIKIPIEKFIKLIFEYTPNDYKDHRAYLRRSYVDFDRIVLPMGSLRFGRIAKYYELGAISEWVSPFRKFKRKNGYVEIELSPEMETVMDDSNRLKRISNKFLSFIERAEEPLTPPLLLWIGETFYNNKNANAKVVISREELLQRLKGTKKVSYFYAKYFQNEVYNAIKEINKNNLLELVGTNARKVNVTSNKGVTKFKFSVSNLESKISLK